jgi:hypothetical protein
MIFLRLCLDLLPPFALGTVKLLPGLLHHNSKVVIAAQTLRPLFVWYELPDILRLDRRNHGCLAQMSFSLFVLRRENVPFESLIALDLSGAGQAKSFRRRSIGLNFWHWILLYFN